MTLFSDHTISKLIQEIEKKGCQIPSNFFVCQPSPDKVYCPSLPVIDVIW
jgi:hypothetical protein